MIYPDEFKPNVCFSGGAIGADTLFGEVAFNAGHKVVHYHFEEKKANRLHFQILTEDELTAADPYVRQANRFLKRSFPTRSEHANNLLRRNYYQIVDSDVVYAVAPIDPENGFVSGGTAWACAMFLNKYPQRPIYLLNTLDNGWYEWDSLKQEFQLISPNIPPKPKGHWTGIGTRYPTETASMMIEELFLV